MKKLLLTATATLVCFGVFAQGKLAFVNNSDQLAYFTTDKTKLATGDAAKTAGGFNLAGETLWTGANSSIASLTGTPTLIAGLFGGTSASSLTLQTTTTIGDINAAGFLVQANAIFATLPANTAAFFRIDIYDSRNTSAANAWAELNRYGGTTGVFTAVPNGSVYPTIWTKIAPVNSTWASGTFIPTDYAAFPGFKGAIEVWATVPEPGTFALAGLGAAALMIFRRRK